MTWTAGALKDGRMSTAMPSIATAPSTTMSSIETMTAWRLPSAARTNHIGEGLGDLRERAGDGYCTAADDRVPSLGRCPDEGRTAANRRIATDGPGGAGSGALPEAGPARAAP